MSLSSFFFSYPGMYITQAVLHSLVSVIIAEGAIRAWQIHNPLLRQRFRFIVIIVPAVSFPLYQLFDPRRGGLFFRLEALFDMNRWLYLELWGVIPLYTLFIAVLFISTLVFLFQELVPIIAHSLESRNKKDDHQKIVSNVLVDHALENLPGEKPEIRILESDESLLFSLTGKNGPVFLSTGLIERLDKDQLQSALAHEMAHITRSKKPFILLIFLLRMLLFFNPVVLIEFRRIVQEEEKICDDVSVLLTNKPHVLAQTLRDLYLEEEKQNPFRKRRLSDIKWSLEEYSHNVLIKSRIKRLEQGIEYQEGVEWPKLVIAFIVIFVLNYYIV
jgi:Zn-dependent protease with chaperone function